MEMDSSAENELQVKSGEKRSVAEGRGGGSVKKKFKKENLVSDMRKVAEMVLVLAAMGKMRGGRVPTSAEKEIMSAARNKLAEVCQFFAPKDVFPRDVFGGIIEDLGLNKVKEQRLGFLPPKISISEKLLFSKRKVCFSCCFEVYSFLYLIILFSFTCCKCLVILRCRNMQCN